MHGGTALLRADDPRAPEVRFVSPLRGSEIAISEGDVHTLSISVYTYGYAIPSVSYSTIYASLSCYKRDDGMLLLEYTNIRRCSLRPVH